MNETKHPIVCRFCNLEIVEYTRKTILYHPECKVVVNLNKEKQRYRNILADPIKKKKYLKRIGDYSKRYNARPEIKEHKKSWRHNYYMTHKEKWVKK